MRVRNIGFAGLLLAAALAAAPECFRTLGREGAAIRENPARRTGEILKKDFGS